MKFQIYSKLTLKGRRWRWRLRARNGEIIAHGEDYNHKGDCRHAIQLVRELAPGASVEELARPSSP